MLDTFDFNQQICDAAQLVVEEELNERVDWTLDANELLVRRR